MVIPAWGQRLSKRRSTNEMNIANNNGDAGQPCLIPLEVEKGVVGPDGPITTTSPISVACLIN